YPSHPAENNESHRDLLHISGYFCSTYCNREHTSLLSSRSDSELPEPCLKHPLPCLSYSDSSQNKGFHRYPVSSFPTVPSEGCSPPLRHRFPHPGLPAILLLHSHL